MTIALIMIIAVTGGSFLGVIAYSTYQSSLTGRELGFSGSLQTLPV